MRKPRPLPTGHGPTVLFVGDHGEIRDTLAGYLAMEGFRVLCAHDGAAALSALAEIRMDAILTDYRLPDMFGTDVLETAYSKYGLARGAGVMVSGVHPIRGDFAFLQKPCDLDELVRTLWDRAALGRADRKRAQWS